MAIDPANNKPHRLIERENSDDKRIGPLEGLEDSKTQLVTAIVASLLMIMAGLSMPLMPIDDIIWSVLAAHVIGVTLLSNLGKMFPLVCYRNEASLRERLALCIRMFPHAKMGAGFLLVSMTYGLDGMPLTVAVFSLVLNLLMTGLFIIGLKKLIGAQP